MHVAMFSHYCLPHTGGIETVVEALCRRLAARHRVTLVSTAWGAHRGAERDGAWTTWRLPAWHGSEALGVPYPLLAAGRLARQALAEAAEADVFHVHGALYHPSILGRRAARRRGRPLVLTEHVGWVPYRSGLLSSVQAAAWWAVGGRTVAEAGAIVVLNERVRDWLAGRSVGRLHLISNGVDLDRFGPGDPGQRAAARAALGLPASTVLGLFVGRDTPKKNRRALLEAPRAGWTLVLAGAPRAVDAPGVVDLGLLDAAKMPGLYRACDFLVHLAEGEGFPMAVQEAMATGLPAALRWDPGYAATLARDVVAAGDGLAATLMAADALAADPSARADFAARGLDWAGRRWSWDATVAAYEALYTGLAGAST